MWCGHQWSFFFFFAFHKGALLFDGNAKEAFEKAKEANGGELRVKDCSVTWQLLEGDEEKEALKRIIEAQQETQRNKGRGKMNFSKMLEKTIHKIHRCKNLFDTPAKTRQGTIRY